MQGLSFIVTIAGMIYHDVKKIADESKVCVRWLEKLVLIFPSTCLIKLYLPK